MRIILRCYLLACVISNINIGGNGTSASLRLPPNPHIRKYAAVCRLHAPCICTVSANILVPRRICVVAFASESSHTEVCCGLSASRALHLHRSRQIIQFAGGSKGGISRPAKMRKPQCTGVHEDFRIKYNAESTLLTHPLVFHFIRYLFVMS